LIVEILLILVAIVVAACLMLLIGRALGDPKPRKFDETPADVVALDVSDGTPMSHEDWDINAPRQMTPEEQSQATREFERLRVRIEAERR
jgi:hypothetical protein